MDFLSRVIEQKKAEIAIKRDSVPLEALVDRVDETQARDLTAAITGGQCIIAEVKKKSPAVEHFRQTPNADTLATVYEGAGAAAISVVGRSSTAWAARAARRHGGATGAGTPDALLWSAP